jgi:hypothetical protein
MDQQQSVIWGRFDQLEKVLADLDSTYNALRERLDPVTPSLSDIIEAEELDVEVTHTALDDARAVVAAVERAFDRIVYSPEIKV